MGKQKGLELFHILSDYYVPKSGGAPKSSNEVVKDYQNIQTRKRRNFAFIDLIPIASKCKFRFQFIIKTLFKHQHKTLNSFDTIIGEAIELYKKEQGWESIYLYQISKSSMYRKLGCEYVDSDGIVTNTQITLKELKTIWAEHNEVVADLVWTTNINNYLRVQSNQNEDRLLIAFTELVIENINSDGYITAKRFREIKNELIPKNLVSTHNETILKKISC